jgi:polyisoprenoid-binding protein YceI
MEHRNDLNGIRKLIGYQYRYLICIAALRDEEPMNTNRLRERWKDKDGNGVAVMRNLVGSWRLDPDRTTLVFKTKALWILPVTGVLRATGGTGSVNANGDVAGSLVVDATSIDTKVAKRDAHLRSSAFLETDTYPTITFRAGSADIDSSLSGKVLGELSFHGETHPLTLTVVIEVSDGELMLHGDAVIDRRLWGIPLATKGAGVINRVSVAATFVQDHAR